MDKFVFDEQQLEQLLRSMPTIRDHQDPEQLFASISSRLEYESDESEYKEVISPRTKRRWMIPSFATAAAVVMIALMIPSFMQEENSSMENTMMKQEEATLKGMEESQVLDRATLKEAETSLTKMAPVNDSHVITAISEDEQVITVAIPDQNAQFVVPLSKIVPKSESKLAQVALIDEPSFEAELGLASNILKDISLSEDASTKENNNVILDLPESHPYKYGSAMEIIFLEAVEQTFKQMGYDTVLFQTEGKSGITLGNYGELNQLPLKNEKTKDIYYLYEPEGSEQELLVPFSGTNNFENALESMKTTNEIGIQHIKPSIPQDIQFSNISAEQEKKNVVVEFFPGTELQDETTFITMIEAILMTAKEYEYDSVEFKNTPSDSIGSYKMTEPIQVPLGVNPIP